MTTWFTSDLHFGHKNIIKYSRRFLAKDPDKPTREETQAMDELLIANWNSAVASNDEVWNLGDLAFCCSDEHALGCLERLNGKHHMVRGNNDEIAQRLPLQWHGDLAEVTVEGQAIVLCHYAMREWHHALMGVWHLFGHTHGILPGFGKSVDVGVDNAHRIITAAGTGPRDGVLGGALGCTLRPVSFAEVKAYMDKQPIGAHAEFGHGFVPSTHVNAAPITGKDMEVKDVGAV